MDYFGFLKVYALTWMDENYMGLFNFLCMLLLWYNSNSSKTVYRH